MAYGAGCTCYRSTGLKATATDVKTNAVAYVTGFSLHNLDAADVWLQIFDAADHTSVTLGTTTPLASIHVGSSADKDVQLAKPLGVTNGLVIAATTTAQGSGNPATGVDVNLFFQ